MRKVRVQLMLNVDIVADEGIEIQQVINELDYDLTDTTGKATVNDTEMVDYTIIDSR